MNLFNCHIPLILSCLILAVPGLSQTACPFMMPKKEEVYTVWETPPLLLAREMSYSTVEDGSDPQKASENALLQFVYQHLRYPAISRDHCIEGTIVIGFHIDTEGMIDRESIRCVRDIGGGFGNEGIRIIRLMADLGMRWQPATSQGAPIPVRYYIPIRIKLQ